MMANGKGAPGRGRGRCTTHLLLSIIKGGIVLAKATAFLQTLIQQPCIPAPHQSDPPSRPVGDPVRLSADSYPTFAANTDTSKLPSLQMVTS